ncbi:MAG: ABC transporter permease, partial [Chloroflexota bacterium]|nr:ABC transporter permease [Chloroflexota bacterium]
MSGAFEVIVGPLRAVRRAAFWWSVGLASLVAVTVAFWPAFRGSSGITEAIDRLPAGVVQAFGLANFGTPAGYLRGNLYELFIPLLFSAAAIALTNGQTAGEEASGRLELFFAQPFDRRVIFLGRAIAALLALMVISGAVAIVQIAADAAVGLAIEPGRLLSTILLCALLGALHGSFAVAIAGIGARPSLVLGLGIGVALAGYIVAALFPLASGLEPWRHLSPWDWAFGGDPLEMPTELWRYAALATPSVILIAIGAES